MRKRIPLLLKDNVPASMRARCTTAGLFTAPVHGAYLAGLIDRPGNRSSRRSGPLDEVADSSRSTVQSSQLDHGQRRARR